jgi:hypothetical protein
MATDSKTHEHINTKPTGLAAKLANRAIVHENKMRVFAIQTLRGELRWLHIRVLLFVFAKVLDGYLGRVR